MISKLYCFVDETGQDTTGKLFLVVAVIKDVTDIPTMEKKLEQIEQRTGKKILKWKKTSKEIKKKYLEEIIKIKELKKSVFYAIYKASCEYPKLTSLTIAKAVLASEAENYTVNVIIDGLNEKERETVRRELKRLKIKYRKIRGMRDESSVFLRLADAAAGFLREVTEGVPYTKPFMKQLEVLEFVSEI